MAVFAVVSSKFSPALVYGFLLCICAIPSQGLAAADLPSLLAKAQGGDVDAQFDLAYAYDSGQGTARNEDEALRWYLAAAQKGHIEAMNSAGSILQVNKRFAEALLWYQQAADKKHAQATNSLAYLYDLGLGVTQDRQKAFALYMRAAELGWAEAMWNIANMYGAGQLGAPADLTIACVWATRAIRFVDVDEERLRVYLVRHVVAMKRRLSAEQLAACSSQAPDWTPSQVSLRSDKSHRKP